MYIKTYHIRLTFLISLLVCTAVTGCSDSKLNSETSAASFVDTAGSVNSSDTSSYYAQEAKNTVTSIDKSRKNAITKAVKEVSPAVVNITVTEVVKGRKLVQRGSGFYRRFGYVPYKRNIKSIGSGFIISKDGLVVTNAHVANKKAKKIIVTLSDGTQYKAELVGADKLSDIALLQLHADRSLPYVEFANSEKVLVGEWAVAIGNPFGLFNATRPSVTVGVVSAVHRDFRPNPKKPRVYLDMIQTDAAINQGNSGGPLVNSEGEVIGINTFIFTGGTGQGFVGLGFAIPSNRAKKIVQELAKDGDYNKQFDIGLNMRPTTYRFVVKNRVVLLPGLFVTSVNRDGPAFKGGIIPGDIILKMGDTSVQSLMHAKAIMREYEVGDSLRIEFVRDDKRYETKVYLRKRISEK